MILSFVVPGIKSYAPAMPVICETSHRALESEEFPVFVVAEIKSHAPAMSVIKKK